MTGSADRLCGIKRYFSTAIRQATWSFIAFVGVTALGCYPDAAVDGRSRAARRAGDVQPASFAVRAQRRAFDGAPAIIPHEPFGVDCVTCHTPTGNSIPTIGVAPANPHYGDARAGALENCRQCHLFSHTTTVFVANSFQGRLQRRHAAERAHPTAPPVTPHSLSMRTNCLACHAGPAARPEILCTHPERTNCVQCHLAIDLSSEDQELIPQARELAEHAEHEDQVEAAEGVEPFGE